MFVIITSTFLSANKKSSLLVGVSVSNDDVRTYPTMDNVVHRFLLYEKIVVLKLFLSFLIDKCPNCYDKKRSRIRVC